ncbi:MAG TPA: HAMP domain-containing sensor histidine kinase [Steroidobacteraceae bacterium]|nr:HAMP domain-containing sensor histidine kinase [Steroidobacteraceae bacterium]
MRPSLWPQSLFGRLIAALVIAVVLAQAASLYLFARDRERFVVDSSVREWSRRITEITLLLEQLPTEQRATTIATLKAQAGRLSLRMGPRDRGPRDRGPQERLGEGPLLVPPLDVEAPQRDGPPPEPPLGTHLMVRERRPPEQSQFWPRIFIQLPFVSDVRGVLTQQLRGELGNAYQIAVHPAAAPAASVIPIPSPFFGLPAQRPTESYDVDVRLPDASSLVYRVTRVSPGTPLPPSLMLNLILLVVVLVIALYVVALGITRPLSRLALAADNLGRSIRQPKLEEEGARELRRAARAFNTMQDRLHRYLDSRTRVLAAMSHDLKTPLTRLRLQVETQIEDPALQARFGRELDEMESMVRGALALFRGLDDDEAPEPVDINLLLETVRGEFVEMGEEVTLEGRALSPISGKPQALKRCLTNLIANAVKFGNRARILVQDGVQLEISVCDEGPGIPPQELEKVFEPFYRLESSRNRDTGGTGLGLSIARDVAQTHGGSLVLLNRPEGGLEARLTLPRRR